MTSFRVDDMTCGHCTAVITEALQAIDPGARICVNLASHRVDIDAETADVARLRGAIEAAGYAAIHLESGVAAIQRIARSGSACCCG